MWSLKWISPGEVVMVDIGASTGARAAIYLGTTGGTCDDDRVLHVRDIKTRKMMGVHYYEIFRAVKEER